MSESKQMPNVETMQTRAQELLEERRSESDCGWNDKPTYADLRYILNRLFQPAPAEQLPPIHLETTDDSFACGPRIDGAACTIVMGSSVTCPQCVARMQQHQIHGSDGGETTRTRVDVTCPKCVAMLRNVPPAVPSEPSGAARKAAEKFVWNYMGPTEHFPKETLAFAFEQHAAAAVREAERSAQGWKEQAGRWRSECFEHRAKAHGDYWCWQGDNEDHLESLTCPVLINAETLRRLIRSAPTGAAAGNVEGAER